MGPLHPPLSALQCRCTQAGRCTVRILLIRVSFQYTLAGVMAQSCSSSTSTGSSFIQDGSVTGLVNSDDSFHSTHTSVPDVTIRTLKNNCDACRPWKQLLAQFLSRQPGEVAAAVRTTIAVTGVTTHPAAGNVLPSLATAQLNFRYLPGLCLFTHESGAHVLPGSLTHS